jgi:hypothetical protein
MMARHEIGALLTHCRLVVNGRYLSHWQSRAILPAIDRLSTSLFKDIVKG